MTTVPIWRNILRQNFTDWKALLSFLHLEDQKTVLRNPKFSLNLPTRLASKIEKGNWQDPILRQFLPTVEELQLNPLFVSDPVSDACFQKKPKLLHKYHGRALLLCTSACAMHCRFCFRQNFDYEISDKLFEEEIAAIAAEPTLSEIILSGGDPLSLSDGQLRHILTALDAIPHVKRIRFHTRFPIGIPERIDDHFLQLLASCRAQIIFIIHCNHPQELDEDILGRLKKIRLLGIPILSQSVLLHKVNDDFLTLKALFERLVDNGIMPYYLHQLDRVQGATHFEASEEKGRELMEELAKACSGYAIPKYVREVPNQPNKTPI